MAWIIRIDGIEFDSDDMLLDDLAVVEKTTGTYWSIANPFKEIAVAKAFLRVALVRSGVSEEDADERLKSITLRDTKSAFDFRDDATPARAEGKGAGPTDQTSPSSSPGGRSGSDGRRKRSAPSDSETSSS